MVSKLSNRYHLVKGLGKPARVPTPPPPPSGAPMSRVAICDVICAISGAAPDLATAHTSSSSQRSCHKLD
ncbi:hypothetical protein RRG08_063324 [Elysia crispata]|uniref:Uncharacterized protein n=1 Tax=Elysia crispata TaxID=231223 RepID=A0AAE0ZWC7_9GAST|nr:hypothetical protein RRG08_063324 [Elysia crispata]